MADRRFPPLCLASLVRHKEIGVSAGSGHDPTENCEWRTTAGGREKPPHDDRAFRQVDIVPPQVTRLAYSRSDFLLKAYETIFMLEMRGKIARDERIARIVALRDARLRAVYHSKSVRIRGQCLEAGRENTGRSRGAANLKLFRPEQQPHCKLPGAA